MYNRALFFRVLFKPMTMMLHCRSHEYKNVKFLTAVSKLYLHIFQHLFVFKLSDRCEGGPNSVHCNNAILVTNGWVAFREFHLSELGLNLKSF